MCNAIEAEADPRLHVLLHCTYLQRYVRLKRSWCTPNWIRPVLPWNTLTVLGIFNTAAGTDRVSSELCLSPMVLVPGTIMHPEFCKANPRVRELLGIFNITVVLLKVGGEPVVCRLHAVLIAV